MFEMNDRVALITGAASGIGAEVARTYARAGATLALVDIDEAAAQSVLEELGSDRNRFFRCDLEDAAQCVELISATEK